MNDWKKLINWREFSREVSTNPENIRANNIPKKYQAKVNRLKKVLEQYFKDIKTN